MRRNRPGPRRMRSYRYIAGRPFMFFVSGAWAMKNLPKREITQ